MNVVFCGGVHGVGKTRFCHLLAELSIARHVSASALVEDLSTARPSKVVLAPEQNQTHILDLLENLDDLGLMLLDGHFCLIGVDRQIHNVPVNVFTRLAPRALLVLFEDPGIVSSRLRDRDLVEVDPTFIHRFQTAEISHAEAVSKVLGIPLQIVTSTDSIAQTAQWIQDSTRA